MSHRHEVLRCSASRRARLGSGAARGGGAPSGLRVAVSQSHLPAAAARAAGREGGGGCRADRTRVSGVGEGLDAPQTAPLCPWAD